jgi:probable F420-dependent oxidoreductase
VQLLTFERWPSYRAIGDAALTCEAQGYDAVVLADHLLSPLLAEDQPIGPTWPEVHTLAAYMAGRTDALRFCFYATVVPYRNPIVQANQIITLDQVSNGRVTVVTGIGWLAEEFEALGVPFKGRGVRTDEYIRAMRVLWTEAEASFHGDYINFDKVAMEPKCVQRPHVPLWVGGIGKHARKRIVEYGDGWGAPIPWPLDRLGREVERVKRDVSAAGRDPETLSYAAGLTFGEIDQTVRDLASHVGSIPTGSAFATTAEEAIDLVGQYRDMGFTDIVVNTNWTSPADLSDKLGAFAQDVMSKFPSDPK